MSLNVHLLNVGHGDSLVVEYRNGDGSSYGLVDSNAKQGQSKALQKLRELGAQRLSFVLLTHPHRDHYAGLLEVLQEFRGRIDNFFIFPTNNIFGNRKRLKKYAEEYKKIRDSQDDPATTASVSEFLGILMELDRSFSEDQRIECDGEFNAIAPRGFENVEMFSILPPKRMKGGFLQRIDEARGDIVESLHENKISVALLLRYAGRQVLLGGDGTFENWMMHRRFISRSRHINVRSALVKLPHHGSSKDSGPDVLEGLFVPDDDRYALISADGRSHPSEEAVRWLVDNGIKPYCTNLMAMCGARQVDLVRGANVAPEMRKYIQQIAEPASRGQPCQGDVAISISSAGDISVQREFNNPCPFRGDYDALLQPQSP